jgi:hypothetical protein
MVAVVRAINSFLSGWMLFAIKYPRVIVKIDCLYRLSGDVKTGSGIQIP